MSKTGYCSLCKHPQVTALNNAINAGKGYVTCLREMDQAFGMSFAKGTFLKHKEHITAPLITAAEDARKNALTPRNNRAVLEAIRDIGMRKALDDPDSVKIDHALRAAKILQDAEGKQETVLVLLAKAVQGPTPQPETIEGEYTEVPQLE